MSYKHGVYTFEQPTSIVPPRTVSSALPIVFGAAPVNQVTAAVTDEEQTFAGTITLDNTGVRFDTIVVKDATGETTYDLTTDYTVALSGSDCQITFVVDGGISDGDTVLVSYEYENPEANKLKLVHTYQAAVAALGYSDDWDKFTLCEFMKCYFGLFAVAPVVFVNVLDPASHTTSVTAEAQTFVDDEITLNYEGVLHSSIVVTDGEAEPTTYTEVVDYTADFDAEGKTVITRTSDGSVAAGASVEVSYDHLDTTGLAASDITGGITSGVKTGLELVNEVFPQTRLVPGQIVAPGWSHETDVAATMAAKAGNINGHFKAMALVDMDDTGVTVYSDAPATKNTNNLVDEHQIVCWGKCKLGGKTYHMSTQLASLTAQVDADHEGVPYASPSNHNFQMDAFEVNSTEIFLGLDEANYLNGQGIVTALNFIGGWKCWGNRTGTYPGVTDVKDAFVPVRRMFNWIGNTLVLTFWQKVDYPINRRLIETIVDSANIWLNGLTARQFILGGRVEFNDSENTTTALMDGKIFFHVYITPPSPAREIDFMLEYDPNYLSTLFGS